MKAIVFDNEHVKEFPQVIQIAGDSGENILDLAIETGMVSSRTQGRRLPQLEGTIKAGWNVIRKGQRVLEVWGIDSDLN